MPLIILCEKRKCLRQTYTFPPGIYVSRFIFLSAQMCESNFPCIRGISLRVEATEVLSQWSFISFSSEKFPFTCIYIKQLTREDPSLYFTEVFLSFIMQRATFYLIQMFILHSYWPKTSVQSKLYFNNFNKSFSFSLFSTFHQIKRAWFAFKEED